MKVASSSAKDNCRMSRAQTRILKNACLKQSRKRIVKLKIKTTMETRGIEPRASRMRSERSTISYELRPHLVLLIMVKPH